MITLDKSEASKFGSERQLERIKSHLNILFFSLAKYRRAPLAQNLNRHNTWGDSFFVNIFSVTTKIKNSLEDS